MPDAKRFVVVVKTEQGSDAFMAESGKLYHAMDERLTWADAQARRLRFNHAARVTTVRPDGNPHGETKVTMPDGFRFVVPELPGDAELWARPNTAHARIRLERRIICALMETLKGIGYVPHSAGDDGDGNPEPVGDARSALESLSAVDDSRLYFQHVNTGARRWVLIVLGNGVDCIADYGQAPGGDENAWNAAMSEFDPYRFE